MPKLCSKLSYYAHIMLNALVCLLCLNYAGIIGAGLLAILVKLIANDVLTSTSITRKSLQTFYRNWMNISKLVVPEVSCTNVTGWYSCQLGHHYTTNDTNIDIQIYQKHINKDDTVPLHIIIVAIATVVAIEMVDPIIDITILLSAVELNSWNGMENDGIAPQIMLKNQFTQINCVCN